MHEIAAHDGDQETDDEGRVGRASKQVDARQDIEHQAEDRRVPAESVKHHHHERRREEANVARPQQPAEDADAENQDDSEDAAIDLAHILREKELVG